jgi:hypothetical protein
VINFVDLKLPYSNRQFLDCGARVHNRPPTSWAPNIPCPPIHHISSNLIVPIAHSPYHVPPPTYPSLHPHTNHKPQTNYPSDSNKITHHLLVPPTNPNPSCECGVPNLHFPNPFDHAHLKHFSPTTLLVLTIGHDHTPRTTPISSTQLQPPPKVLCPTYGHQFISWRLAHHQHSYQTSNLFNPNPCDHLSSIPSFTPTPPTLT